MRIACVDVPALPLQLLAREHPSWRDAPFAVVEADEPQARILWVDRRAAACRIRPGMRYASALQLSRDLRAAPVPDADIAALRDAILVALQARTPRVEPDAERPGVFWLDPSGLGPLFGSLESWAAHVHGALSGLGLLGAVVVGWARLPAWAIARGRDDVLVLRSPAEEAALAGRTRLVHLDLPPELREALAALDVHHLAPFLALPRGEVGLRFGPGASRLHALFADAMRPPMQPAAFEEEVSVEAELDPPDDDAYRLLFCIKGALHALMAELGRRALALRTLTIRFELERHPAHVERLEPAQPTRDALSIVELIRLRLADLSIPSGVERVALIAEPAKLDGRQLELFAGRRRDPDAAARSLARLRAAFGEEAVTRAELRDAWLPEHRFVYTPVGDVLAPMPTPAAEGALVRRVLTQPERLPRGRDGRPRTDPPLVELTGPYRIQGGWWERETSRDYFFAERADGALLWLFHEPSSDAWYLHGHVD